MQDNQNISAIEYLEIHLSPGRIDNKKRNHDVSAHYGWFEIAIC